MRIYFFSRKSLMVTGVLSFFILGFLCFSFCYANKSIQVSHNKEAVYQGNSGKKAVAITVNVDWGEEYIPAMLDSFAKYDARVSFFVTGKWAEKNPELLKQMDKEGHSIQNHGYKHLHFNNLSAADASQQIKQAEDVIHKTIGKKSKFFASPYGEKNQNLINVVADLNYELIMWSVDTIDWQRPEPQVIVDRVLNKVHNDAIILMHPTEPTVKALPELLQGLDGEGYKMVTIDEILVENVEGEGNEART